MSRRALRWTVLAAILLVAAYGAASFLMLQGATSAERKPQEATPPEYGLDYEVVRFPSRSSGIMLEGWYLPSDDRSRAIVFVHGIGGTRSSDSALPIARGLVRSGFSILLFDLRAHGSSGGSRVSAGYFERQDVRGAVDYLLSRADRPRAIGLMGFSMGAGIAILAAAEEPRLDALVADSPFADVSDLIAHEVARKTPFPESIAPVFIPGAGLLADILYSIDLGSLRPERAVQSLPYPVLVVHGTADERIPADHGARVFDAAPAGSDLWLVAGAGHVDSFTAAPEEYHRRVVAYFESRLAGP